MIQIDLPPEVEALIADFARRQGVSKEEFVRRAILDRVEDTEDYYSAEERLRTSDGETVPLEEVMKEFSDDLADAK